MVHGDMNLFLPNSIIANGTLVQGKTIWMFNDDSIVLLNQKELF